MLFVVVSCVKKCLKRFFKFEYWYKYWYKYLCLFRYFDVKGVLKFFKCFVNLKVWIWFCIYYFGDCINKVIYYILILLIFKVESFC